ncbi:sugar transferase, PEP-CTERM system associated/exopolysaccharide biosynthesis polyprenyl glycosylphosphotransferase [Luteibacter sp. UNC138MFCol5.1]|uniref:TIGR03013 family XrtA/PEP-CTERM system glycosyltransferase n=1 Tax=Luteibacter sp. UNC138MFCol5.1 TaxID=1502774 RepID=UPI0008B789C3|nr:TIGR03013 family XrtA/PEP-CTERM system glycosyltransferase [Luteibacter sp. UNC138MFCol5.1]SEO95394.1 sugar transferase, PEP-CTERM system associated/exopolysaccharide biosynthesis polyprenyl glycosylphosphotransferase [Luteibacter sp. UNC138MFCol5.1]
MIRLFRQPIVRWLTLLGTCELLLLAASLNAATWIRFAPSPEDLAASTHTVTARATMFAVVIFLCMAALGEYRSTLRMSWRGQLARHAIAFALGGLALVVGYYVIPQAYVGRGVLGMALIIAFIATAGFRALFMRLVEMESLKRRVLVLGAGQRAAQIHTRMRRRSDRRGFCLLGYVQGPNETVAIPEALLVKSGSTLAELARRERLDEIVVGVDDRRGSLPMDDLLACRQLGVQITDLTTFVEREAGRVQLTMLDPSWLVFSGGFNATPVALFVKRAFDIGAASLIALLCWPIMLGVMLAIRIESGHGQPILYRQERVGEHGRTFWLYKFRSMRTDAEMDGVARWASSNDDRITRVGRICRKLRFDELPQLWNVIRGDMSIVGPRPERPQFVSDLETKIRFYNLRHSIKPGLAGWAQLSYPYGASEEDAAEKLKYDLFYVKNHNLFLDVVILIETVEVVLFGRGAR